jgi:hypothetical protein
VVGYALGWQPDQLRQVPLSVAQPLTNQDARGPFLTGWSKITHKLKDTNTPFELSDVPRIRKRRKQSLTADTLNDEVVFLQLHQGILEIYDIDVTLSTWKLIISA